MDTNEHVLRLRMACVGDVSRFRIVMLLTRTSALSVSGIAREVGLSQSCTTRHLQALRRVGVVERARAGKEVRFALRREDPDLFTLLGWIAASSPDALDSPPVAPPRAGGEAPRARRASFRVARSARIADTATVRVSKEPGKSARRGSKRVSTPPPGIGEPAAAGPEPGPRGPAGNSPPSAEPEPDTRPFQRLGSDLEDYLL